MSKLHIPHPDQQEDDDGFSPVWLGMVVATAVAILILLYFNKQAEPEPGAPQTIAEKEAAAAVKKLSRESKRKHRLAMSFDKRKPSELEKREWKDKELLAVLEFSSRVTNEAACRAYSPLIAESKLSDPVRIDLVKFLDRRKGTAPYTCLSRLFFAGKLDSFTDAKTELEEIWSNAEAFDEFVAPLVASVLDEFRTTRDRPEAPRFFSWVRVCALNFDYKASKACQQLVSSIRPKEGVDLLSTMQKQLVVSGERKADIPIMIRALGAMGREGQPEGFIVKESKELPDYDVDFRHGALFMLCRFMFTPDNDVSELAATELGDIAAFGARGFDDKLKDRWKETCRLAFMKGESDPLKFLAVWDGNPDNPPIYSIRPEIESGHCKQEDGYPLWWCGAKQWNGEGRTLDVALQDFFVETRYLEVQGWE